MTLLHDTYCAVRDHAPPEELDERARLYGAPHPDPEVTSSFHRRFPDGTVRMTHASTVPGIAYAVVGRDLRGYVLCVDGMELHGHRAIRRWARETIPEALKIARRARRDARR